jgi:hypothetical protein
VNYSLATLGLHIRLCLEAINSISASRRYRHLSIFQEHSECRDQRLEGERQVRQPAPAGCQGRLKGVQRAWRETDPAAVTNSISAAGFSDNVYDWHIARHYVYGENFMAARDTESGETEEEDAFNLHESDDCLDEITILRDDE